MPIAYNPDFHRPGDCAGEYNYQGLNAQGRRYPGSSNYDLIGDARSGSECGIALPSLHHSEV